MLHNKFTPTPGSALDGPRPAGVVLLGLLLDGWYRSVAGGSILVNGMITLARRSSHGGVRRAIVIDSVVQQVYTYEC